MKKHKQYKNERTSEIGYTEKQKHDLLVEALLSEMYWQEFAMHI